MTLAFETWKEHPKWPWTRYVAIGCFMLAAALLIVLLVLPRDDQRALSRALEGLKGGSTGGILLAYSGVLFIVAAQTYTLVKRTGDPLLSKKMGGAKLWLTIHIVLSAAGFIFVMLHSGFPYQFRSTRLFNLGFAGLATWFLLITTASGVFGRYLYVRLPAMKRAFRYWKPAHLMTTGLTFFFALFHIATMIR